MIGWVGDIESATESNDTFRTALFTGQFMQLTVMRLLPGEEIGKEVHPDVDQFIRVEQGVARLELGFTENDIDETHSLKPDWACIIPAGTWHNVVNDGDTDLRLYSLYTPPEHPDGTVHITKAEADEAEAAAHGH